MKFSVLLPTRNRLELLRYAVESVRRQDDPDWEIVISDNFSEEDIAGYVRSLDDPRIRYFRTHRFVPVTENWNNALERSTGEYVIMLGDDDCLLEGYFSGIRRLLRTHPDPDFIYRSALLYAYPGVMPGHPDGFLQTYGYASFFSRDTEAFWLDRKRAVDLVRKSMNFRVDFGYNMQYSLIRRGFIESLRGKGEFFQSPFPDYYAHNVMFLTANRILIDPMPAVVIGISPKSFGYFHFNQREKQGVEFLKNLADPGLVERLQDVLLPGTTMYTSWLLAMETVRRNFGAEYGVRPNYARYRFLQSVHLHTECFLNRSIPRDDVDDLYRLLHGGEKLLYGHAVRVAAALLKAVPTTFREKLIGLFMVTIGPYVRYVPRRSERRYRNILEIFDRTDPLCLGKAASRVPAAKRAG